MAAITPQVLTEMSDEQIAALTTEEALEALRAVPGMHRDVRQRQHDLIAAARRRGMTWKAIAYHLGLENPQAAAQRWKRLESEFGG